jgi:hypothetical protein
VFQPTADALRPEDNSQIIYKSIRANAGAMGQNDSVATIDPL